jgi:flagellar motor switch protein FliN
MNNPMDGMLSQEEINALLNGMNNNEQVPQSDAPDNKAGAGSPSTQNTDGTLSNLGDASSESLTDAEKDAVGEVANISMGTAATTLNSLVNQKVNITTPVVTYAKWSDLIKNYDRPCVFIQIYYKEGLDGNNILVLKEKDVKVITDLMMGGDGSNTTGELTDLHLSAISEAMNQMMGSAATSISSMINKKVDISPPVANLVDLTEIGDVGNIAEFLRGWFVKVSFRMQIGNLVDSELMQLYPFNFARSIYKMVMGEEEPAAPAAPIPAAAPQPMPAPMQQPAPPQQYQAAPAPMQSAPQYQQMQPQPQQMYQMPQQANVNVAPAQFTSFPQFQSPLLGTENIDLLLDVPLEVTVELGRTSKTIKEILDFAPGTIIELNQLSGEPIDVLVNGKYVAKGEVVVIEEAFGIRITEIIKDSK